MEKLKYDRLSNQGLDFHAVFLSMNAPFEATMLLQEYETVLDSCNLNSGIPTYVEDAFTLRTDYGLPDSFGGYTTISAGDVVNFVNSDETIFWSLYKFAGVDFTRYSHDTDPYDDQ